ncbi:Myb/SANT-like DNA-binding domain [Popillia japonica]|uniref:Regulatory protein zeste n=1 Tax=Popillia japonica TaxID=7064 RepID=A0AAW1HX02_POPJA
MSASKKPKRARTRNTSVEQYNTYLAMMENDFYFRSNTINPSIGVNYTENKWKELAKLLNVCGDGPQLAVDEWKKRFTDWKYSVRQKYRK